MALRNSPYRRIRWARPQGQNRPDPINLALSRLRAAIDEQRGPLWDLLANAPVSGSESRQRRLRSDGAENLYTLLATLIFNADFLGGFLGKPKQGGGHWKRYAWETLDRYAYGELVPGERSMRRLERHVRTCKTLELISVRELRSIEGDKYTSHIAIKFVQAKLWNMLGMKAVRSAWRRAASRNKVSAAVAELAEGRAGEGSVKGTGQPKRTKPDQPGDPPPSTDGPKSAFELAVETLGDHFKKTMGRS